MTAAKFEKELARHCSPALAGIKPANIVTFPVEEGACREGLRRLVHDYDRRLREGGVAFRILFECPRRVLVMVYRPLLLERCLGRPAVWELLMANGYEAGRSGQLVEQLGLRIRKSGDQGFPHEIGVFLGYPLEDVVGFIQNKGKDFLYAGNWKVYSDVGRAKALCACWESVKRKALKAVDSGGSVYDAFYEEKTA